LTRLMCRRDAWFQTTEVIAGLFHGVNPNPNHPPAWNMAPNQDAIVARTQSGPNASIRRRRA
jgi:hypothetical protein